MSDVLGPIAFGDQDEQPFLGRELSHSKNYSERTAQIIDEEIRKYLTEGYEMSRRLLTENLDKVHLLADALIEFETLDVEDVEVLLAQGIEVLRSILKNRERAVKPRVAKVTFQSKLAEKFSDNKKDKDSEDKNDKSKDEKSKGLSPIEL
jgi:cell division protease FtsH